MKNIIKMILVVTTLSCLNLAIAANRDPIVTVYVNNQSAQPISLGKTAYNQTELNFTQQIVHPNAGLVEVATAPLSAANISFFMHVTSNPITYVNTAIVRLKYTSYPELDSDSVPTVPLPPPYGQPYIMSVSLDSSHFPDWAINVVVKDSTSH